MKHALRTLTHAALAALATAAFLPTPAHAADWIHIGDSIFVDKGSARINADGTYNVWVKASFDTPTRSGGTFAVALHTVDCSDDTAITRRITTYRSNGTVAVPTFTPQGGWDYFLPGTAFGDFFTAFCSEARK